MKRIQCHLCNNTFFDNQLKKILNSFEESNKKYCNDSSSAIFFLPDDDSIHSFNVQDFLCRSIEMDSKVPLNESLAQSFTVQ